MDTETCQRLADLNRAFYARFADDFARTRRGWPPGFDLILPYLPPGANVLDLGCGNGRLLAFLAARGWRGDYLGADSSSKLLERARQVASQVTNMATNFVPLDLLTPNWPTYLPSWHVDRIVCLAVLHHIPGRSNRERFVAGCSALLPPGGLLILSTWQFISADRLRARILPWTTIGLGSADVEPGDYLLSWGEGATGQRYCASIDREQVKHLAAMAGLECMDTFYADGREGNLNLYGVFSKRDS